MGPLNSPPVVKNQLPKSTAPALAFDLRETTRLISLEEQLRAFHLRPLLLQCCCLRDPNCISRDQHACFFISKTHEQEVKASKDRKTPADCKRWLCVQRGPCVRYKYRNRVVCALSNKPQKVLLQNVTNQHSLRKF